LRRFAGKDLTKVIVFDTSDLMKNTIIFFFNIDNLFEDTNGTLPIDRIFLKLIHILEYEDLRFFREIEYINHHQSEKRRKISKVYHYL
jgi:hypothetical protein